MNLLLMNTCLLLFVLLITLNAQLSESVEIGHKQLGGSNENNNGGEILDDNEADDEEFNEDDGSGNDPELMLSNNNQNQQQQHHLQPSVDNNNLKNSDKTVQVMPANTNIQQQLPKFSESSSEINKDSGDVDENSDVDEGNFDEADDQDAVTNQKIGEEETLEASTYVMVTFQSSRSKLIAIISKPGIMAGIIGGAVIGLLTAMLLIMFIVYRMRKKDEGSYALEETKKPLHSYDYRNCPTKEFYA